MLTQSIPFFVAFAALSCWLLAGVFFAFSDFIMKSLRALPTQQGVAAMQSINILVYRSVFMVGLFAMTGISVLFVGYSAVMEGSGSGLLIAAGVLYLITVIGVSAVGNITLNTKLAALNPSSPGTAAIWQHYFRRWTAWNHVRTAGATLAASLMTYSAFTMA